MLNTDACEKQVEWISLQETWKADKAQGVLVTIAKQRWVQIWHTS